MEVVRINICVYIYIYIYYTKDRVDHFSRFKLNFFRDIHLSSKPTTRKLIPQRDWSFSLEIN